MLSRSEAMQLSDMDSDSLIPLERLSDGVTAFAMDASQVRALEARKTDHPLQAA